ncbi:hypothetical protein PG275_01910 [Riemerella anatipestifer]|uniref:hypothetical protein n=1 Tax=Riemerella anatipestifer TaxID=34085 RepID=UPI002A8537CC|nr:hypothetical protein [Riemerella anatipestifer]
MELDNIKDLWHREKVSDLPNICLEQQKAVKTPLEKIRANMKMEFWTTFLLMILIVPLYYSQIKNAQQGSLFLLLYIISILIIVYYFVKFYSLYKTISTQNFQTYHNLLNLRYELVLNTELYKSYYISFVPILFSVFLLFLDLNSWNGVMFVVVSLFMTSIIMYVMGRVWLREIYGNYVVEITDLVSELSDESDDFKFNRNSLSHKGKYQIFQKTKHFFGKIFGKYATLANWIFWFFILIIISGIIGYMIGYFSILLGNVGN